MKKIFFMALLTLTLAACSSEAEVNEFDYPLDIYQNATITEVQTDGTEAVMTITVTGFNDEQDITVVATANDNLLTDFEVTEHAESDDWGRVLIEETDYLQAIVDHSDNLDALQVSDYTEIDAESGATAGTTGSALIEAAEAALFHYTVLYQ
jgi:hypothetical protein